MIGADAVKTPYRGKEYFSENGDHDDSSANLPFDAVKVLATVSQISLSDRQTRQ
jgi:hypothetical protein